MICPHCLFRHPRSVAQCETCGHGLPGRSAPRRVLVGRARELALLDELLQEVVHNREPRIIAVVGKAGVGRSHLLSEFRRRHDHDFSEITAIRGYPVPGGRRADPYAPFGRLLRNAFGLDELTPAAEQRDTVRRELESLAPPSMRDALRAIGHMTGLRFAETAGPERSGAAPEEERRRNFGTVAWYLRRRSERGPLLVLVDTLDDASPDGLELLAYLHHALVQARVLVLCEIDHDVFVDDPAWFQRFGDGVLPVEPLGLDGVGELMQRLAERPTPPPRNLLHAAYEATRGRPEAVRQVVRTLEAHGILEDGSGSWGVDVDGPVAFDFPLTDEQAARQRLDRLGEADRRWLRRAAVIGSAFWRGALIPLARSEQGPPSGMAQWIDMPSEEELDSVLERAVSAGVLTRLTPNEAPQPRYAFTRARERDLLLDVLEPADRAAMHAVVAEWLEYRMGLEDEALLLDIAQHYERGQNRKRAASYYIMAGDRARHRFANEAAVEAFERSAQLLDARDALALIDVFHALGALHTLGGRFELAESCFERMLGYAWVLDRPAKAGAALNRLGRMARDRAQYERAQTLLVQARDLFARAEDTPGVAASIDDLGQLALLRGERELALVLFTEALTIRRSVDDRRAIALSLNNLGRLQRDSGYLGLAESTLREALEIRQGIHDTSGVITSGLELAELYVRRAQLEPSREYAAEALEMARMTGDQGQIARALVITALIAARAGDTERARVDAEDAGALAEQLGDVRTQVRSMRAVAQVELDAGQPADALGMLDRAAQLAYQHGEAEERGICLRLLGRAHTHMSKIDLRAAAAEARSIADGRIAAAPNSAGDEGCIDALIDEALGAGVDEPPQVAALGAAHKAHLDAAIEEYGDAVRVLGDVNSDVETIEALREMAVVVEASGEVDRARALSERAELLSADFAARAERTVALGPE